MTLAEFLRARLAEDEAAVTRIEVAPMHGVESSAEADYLRFADRGRAEVDAKRRIVAGYQHLDADPDLRMHAWTFALRCLALPYAGLPDYREEWRP